MFQGSRNVESGEHFSALMAEGGRLNATTWFDRTNYFETVPNGALELALWLEADRHGHLLDAVTQENLDNQRDVVKEEKRQRYDNVPYGKALIDIYATVFPEGHPYHHPTIGSMEDLDAATLEDVHAFFRHYYGPNNSVLTLVGDVDPGGRVRRGGDVLRTAAGLGRSRRRHDRPPARPARPSRCGSTASRTCPTTGSTSPSGCPSTATRTTSPARWPSTSSAASHLAARAPARPRRADRPRRSTRTRMGLVDGVSLGLLTIDVAAGTDADARRGRRRRGDRAAHRSRGPTTSSWSPRSPRPSARGSARWPARRSAPT